MTTNQAIALAMPLITAALVIGTGLFIRKPWAEKRPRPNQEPKSLVSNEVATEAARQAAQEAAAEAYSAVKAIIRQTERRAGLETTSRS